MPLFFLNLLLININVFFSNIFPVDFTKENETNSLIVYGHNSPKLEKIKLYISNFLNETRLHI